MALTMGSQNLHPKNGMSLMIEITQNILKEVKLIQVLNLKQMLFFMIIHMHLFL